MNLVVTPIYAFAVSIIYMILWFRVTSLRAELGHSIGDGGDPKLLLRIRLHGNCFEWSVFIVLLMTVAEGAGVSTAYLHVFGVLLLVDRIAHPFGLKIDRANHPLRYVGNGPNIIATVGLITSLGISIFGR